MLAAAVIVGTLVIATWSLAGTLASSLLLVPAPPPGVAVISVDGGTITLAADPATTRPGVWGLVGDLGTLVVGDVESATETAVRREVHGAAVDPGPAVRVDRIVYGPDPAAIGVPFSEVILEGTEGDLAAWVVPGSDDTWVVYAHDFGADRTEALRALRMLHELGLPVVVPDLRGDAAPGERSDLGMRRWREVAVAIDFALGAGANDVVLFGSGTGASAALLATAVNRYDRVTAALVLDSPLLDPAGDADRRLTTDKVPGFLIGWSKAVVTFRYGVEWAHLDHVAVAASQRRPVLIFHGDRDQRFSAGSSLAFATAAPEATLIGVAGAGFGEAWNLDPAGYEARLAEFLRDTVVGRSGAVPGG